MGWDEYASQGDDVRGEYIDGRLVLTPFPSRQHQDAARRLAGLLEQHLPAGHEVVTAWGWKPGADEYGPDVMVHPPHRRAGPLHGHAAAVRRGALDEARRRPGAQGLEVRPGGPAAVLGPRPGGAEPAMYALEDGAYRQVGVVTGRGEVPGWPGLVVDLDALLAD